MSTDIEQATVERMVALVRKVERSVAHLGISAPEWADEARAIAALLPAPVDPDLETARDIVSASLFDFGGSVPLQRGQAIRSGLGDDTPAVRVALAALRKAREEGAK